MRRIAIVLFPGLQLLDVAGPLDVFAEANELLPPGKRYALTTVAETRAPLRASNGMSVVADLTFDEAQERFDTVLVAGGPDLPRTVPSPRLLDWVKAAAKTAACVGSICTGAFILGHARLLDGRSAVTHWRHVHELEAQFPTIQVEPDRIFVRDGAVLTSAGVTAGIDLSLALVAQDHGAAMAALVAKRLLVFVQRQGGQSQFSPYLSDAGPEDSLLNKVQNFVVEHLAEPLGVERLAAAVSMSPRNFARVFARDAKLSPGEFVQRARIDAARQLLEASDLPIKTVAYRTGFGSAARMRIVFVRSLGVTPTDYRDRFAPGQTASVG